MGDGVFITGGSGLLGFNWAMALRDRLPVVLGLHDRQVTLAGVATYVSSLESVDDVLRTLEDVQPRLVVHAAGLTSVEQCERRPDLAEHINVELAANVAAACAHRTVPLVHVSSDHLFRGDEALVSEDHPVAPQNVYGRTKAEAERRVLAAHAGALVVRTNFYGWGPAYRRSFSDTILDALRRGEPLTLFTDVTYTPILSEVLAHAVHELSDKKVGGIVHLSGDERLSKYDFGVKVAEHLGLDPGLITPGTLSDRPALVHRPRDMSLSNAYACRLLGRSMGGSDAHLARLRQQEQ